MPQDDRIALLAAKLKSMDVDQLKGIAAGYGVEESELHFSESDLLDSGSSIDQSLSMTTLSSSSPVRTRNDRLMQSSQLISRLQVPCLLARLSSKLRSGRRHGVADRRPLHCSGTVSLSAS